MTIKSEKDHDLYPTTNKKGLNKFLIPI